MYPARAKRRASKASAAALQFLRVDAPIAQDARMQFLRVRYERGDGPLHLFMVGVVKVKRGGTYAALNCDCRRGHEALKARQRVRLLNGRIAQHCIPFAFHNADDARAKVVLAVLLTVHGNVYALPPGTCPAALTQYRPERLCGTPICGILRGNRSCIRATAFKVSEGPEVPKDSGPFGTLQSARNA